MSEVDYLYWDFEAEDELGPALDMYEPPAYYGSRCRYCGREQLRWHETDNGWRLFDAQGNVHTCKEYRDHQETVE